ncbi:hypothetical protein [Actinoplanes regularis]|uniref:Uncharacterized protein n=1 Tax=Actinoplanes regularis TaxID=52697 RepID=A0A238XJ43_9ACTN|nr:hypothetical protein [Actinoplanes regularis]GIE90496.1 hypothetical protein Are01nite_69760 [Actinoplanes regularis]SNR58712.1 hypothetical protein SAMN06264365_103488 [Actinoplanes regularis]
MTADQFTLTADGNLSARQTVRDSGAVAYQLTGVMRGTIVFFPHVRDHEAIPGRVAIRFGDGDHLLATHLQNLPTIGDLALIGGGSHLNLDAPGWTRQLILKTQDPGREAESVAAIGYAEQVCQWLADRYRQLDRDKLRLAAARRTANQRLARCVHQRILSNLAERAEYDRELTADWTLAEQLQRLSPLRLLPTPVRPCRCYAFADVYVSSDDDGDWLTCPACDKPTVMIRTGDGLGGLLTQHTEHRCPPDRR